MSETDVATCYPDETMIDEFAPGDTGEDVIGAAYLRGTRIHTPGGETRIEALAIGDHVFTCFGGVQTVKWIGRQSFDGTKLPSHLWPVRFRPGSLGEAMPVRDLFVSPAQAMLVGHALVAADMLVNGVTVTQDDCPARVEYFQLDIGRHDCVIAAGAWSETFADPAPAAQRLCAPQPQHGAALYAALWPVVARAGAGLDPGQLRGFVDLIERETVLHGWAQDMDNPALPVCLDIMLNGRVIGNVLACDFREDLHQEGIGPCGFSFNSPIRLGRDDWPTLQVRRGTDGAALDIAATIRGETRPDLRMVA